MPKPSPARYRTTNRSDYNAALRRRSSLSIRLDPDMNGQAAKSGRRGQFETFSGSAIQVCLIMKICSACRLDRR